ncbi:MAG: PAS domain S-box protein [Chloroflexaceae bacterium]
MWDLIFESIEAGVLGLIIVYLLWIGRREQLYTHKGWTAIVLGFSLIGLGSIVRIADELPLMRQLGIFEGTAYEALFEEGIGGFLGYILIIIGFWHWLPGITWSHRARQELKKTNDDLEMLVATRAAELLQANHQLQQEVEERKAAEQQLCLYHRAILATSSGVLITDPNQPDNPIISCNPAFERISGYTSDEVVGRNCRFLQGPDTDSEARQRIRQAIDNEHECHVLVKNYRKDGTLFWNKLVIAPVRDAGGGLTHFIGIQTDITEWKQAETALRKSEELYRTLARSLPDSSVILFDQELCCIIAEGPALATAGFANQQIEGKMLREVLPRQIYEELMPYYRAAFAGGATICEKTFEKTIYLIHTLPVKNEHDEIFGGMLLVQDITEHRRAEQALRESDKLLRTVIAGAPIFLFALDNTGDFTLLEGKGLDLLQLKPGDAGGRSVFDIYRDMPEVQAYNQRALAGETFTATIAVAGLIFETRYSPLRDEDGNVFSVIGVATDITEREQTREALRHQRDFALQIMNTMGQGLIVTNVHCQFEFVNPACAQMLGATPDALIGRSFSDFVVSADTPILTDAFTRRLAGETTTYEIRLRRSDGPMVYALINGVPRRHADQIIGSIAVISDLTQHRQMEEDLEQARNQALEASRLKSEFLATMSHEIRTPINAIIGMTELLVDTPLAPNQHEFATIVHESGQALLTIIDDILDFSKIEAGKLVLDHVDFCPVHIVEGTADLLSSKAYEKDIALMTWIAPDVPDNLRGDPGRLRQVLINLVGNAIKFTNQGEVVVRVTLESATNMNNVVLRFAISDTGIGLSNAARHRLFEPFTQEDGSTTRRYGGTGLGLAISKHLAELMGGTIGFESVLHQGSTFWFTARFEHIAAPNRLAFREQNDLRGARALLVMSNRTNQEILQGYATFRGMQCAGTTMGATAQHLLQTAVAEEQPYALAVVDLTLHDMDGFELAQIIRDDPLIANTPLLLLTRLDQREQRQLAAQAGFSAYLTMPVKRGPFLETMVGVLTGTAQMSSVDIGSEAFALQIDTGPDVLHTARTEKLILLVEDNPANQRLALRQLEKLGYTVHAVTNGREAVEAVRCAAGVYALVLMDCQTPEMDGYAATSAIRDMEQTSGRHLPIVAMTANAMQGDREACLAVGMDDYISKPVSLHSLRSVLERWITRTPANNLDLLLPGTSRGASNGCLLDTSVIQSLHELQAAGEPNFLSDLINIYFSDAPIFINKMKTALTHADMVSLCEAVHSFKGSSASIGARTVAMLCRELELLVRSGSLAGAQDLLLRIEAEYERVKPELEAERSGK